MRRRSLAASLLFQQVALLAASVMVAAAFLYHTMLHRALADARGDADDIVTTIEEMLSEAPTLFRAEVLLPVITGLHLAAGVHVVAHQRFLSTSSCAASLPA